MLGFIARIKLRSAVQNDSRNRRKTFLPWDKIEKIALVIEKEDAPGKNAIDKFVDDTKKFVEVFYIETGSKLPSYADWQCFSKKDRSVFNLPKSGLMSSLRKKQFDVVINTCNGANLYAAAISSAIPATLKCATGSHYNYADLIIRKTSAGNLIQYLNDTVKYLKMIRT